MRKQGISAVTSLFEGVAPVGATLLVTPAGLEGQALELQFERMLLPQMTRQGTAGPSAPGLELTAGGIGGKCLETLNKLSDEDQTVFAVYRDARASCFPGIAMRFDARTSVPPQRPAPGQPTVYFAGRSRIADQVSSLATLATKSRPIVCPKLQMVSRFRSRPAALEPLG